MKRPSRNFPRTSRRGLLEAGLEAGDFYTRLVEERFNPEKEKMVKEGATFIEVNPSEFAAVAQKVAEKLETEGNWPKGLFAKVRSMR